MKCTAINAWPAGRRYGRPCRYRAKYWVPDTFLVLCGVHCRGYSGSVKLT